MKTIDEIFKLYCDERHRDFGHEVKDNSFPDLRHFINFCKESCYTEFVNQDVVNDWCYRRERESLVIYRTRLATLRHFLSFAKINGYIDVDCPQKEIMPRKEKERQIDKPIAKSSISDYIENFIEFLRSSGKYDKEINSILVGFNKLFINDYPDAKSLTDDMVVEIFEKKLAKKTQRSNFFYLQAKRFLEYANFKGYLNVKIPYYQNIKYKRQRFPHPFSDEELKKLFFEIDHIPAYRYEDYSSYKFRRLELSTLFRLLYSTGMRTNEAIKLQREDVDLENGIINIKKTKGYHQHRVALHPSMKEILKKYDSAMDKIKPNRNIFFPSNEDTPHHPCWQSKMFNIAWDKVSKDDARPYDLRSNYAVRNINSWKLGEPKWIDKFVYLSRSMGHRDLDSTAYYYQLVPMFREKLQKQTGSNLKKLMPNMEEFLHDDSEISDDLDIILPDS